MGRTHNSFITFKLLVTFLHIRRILDQARHYFTLIKFISYSFIFPPLVFCVMEGLEVKP